MKISQPSITVIQTGIVYRNPIPHVRSRQAYFPSVVPLDNGDLLASLVIGEAFESVDADTRLCRSTDKGETWDEPVEILSEKEKRYASNCARLTATGKGRLVAMFVRSLRQTHLAEGLANPENMGFVPTELLLVRSGDNGKTWSEPEIITPPLEGPSFEACSPVVLLKDGRWIWPTSTWRGWDGYCPNGMKMVAFVSSDQGKTWPEYMDVMDGHTSQIIYWEGKILELSTGEMVAVAWTYDEKNGVDLPNHYALSRDQGKAWSAPASTGILGQTLALIELDEARMLTVYRRMDKPGLWATVARIENDSWINESEKCLWGNQDNPLLPKQQNMVQEFNELKFGAPAITRLADGSLFVVFWCYEKMVSNIRWIKLIVN
ncbi:MAG: sialidase family protein [Bacteroidota bacterium]|nr:sialidase family protein [Bacteroidota bacterium]